MARSMTCLALAIAGALSPVLRPTPAAAQSAPPKRLLGLFDARSGDPIDGVEVRDVFSGVSAVSTATGTVSLAFVAFRGRTGIVELRKIGYTPIQLMLDVADTLPMTELLDRVVELPAAVATAKPDERVPYLSSRLRGFEERRRLAIGQFVPEAELRKHDSQQLSDIVQRYLRSVNLISPMAGRNPTAQYLISMRGRANLRASGPCYVSIYEDGVLIFSANMLSKDRNPPDLRGMGVATYAGIEFYAGGATVPPEYNTTDSGCGVLLLWTRER